VHTPGGVKAIECLREGDLVLAYDPARGQVVERRVVACLRNWTQHLVRITFSGEEVLATRGHPFFDPSTGEWVPASRIEPGARVLVVDRRAAQVEKVETLATEELTYNVEVEGAHNYYVGASGVLVHNSSEESAFESTNQTDVEIYVIKDASGKVVYVGQTIQGIDKRFGQHIGQGHPHWGKGYTPERVGGGKWTAYEAAVWEQHFIDENGGLSKLENKKLGITEANYDKYRSKHKPC
jgi:hypothetical protein